MLKRTWAHELRFRRQAPESFPLSRIDSTLGNQFCHSLWGGRFMRFHGIGRGAAVSSDTGRPAAAGSPRGLNCSADPRHDIAQRLGRRKI